MNRFIETGTRIYLWWFVYNRWWYPVRVDRYFISAMAKRTLRPRFRA